MRDNGGECKCGRPTLEYFSYIKNALSEEGFEPTPTEVDCDLNAAP